MTTHDPTDVLDWNALLQANFGWLHRVVYAHVRDHHATEDILQELGAAAKSWPKTLTGDGAVPRWLYGVAVKQAAQHVRTEIRDNHKTERYAKTVALHDDPAADPARRLIASENAQWVSEALEQLTPRQREVLLLKYFDDLTCREIGTRFGIAESTVQRHLVDARKRLRQVLLRLQEDNHE